MIREIIVQLPGIELIRGTPICAKCDHDDDYLAHVLTLAQCDDERDDGCAAPWEHHRYQPRPWWRRFRTWKGWKL